MSAPASRPLTVALVGAESTGKSCLTQALLTWMHGHTHLRCAAVPEHLRAWCEAAGRAPSRHEQVAVARGQTQWIADACALPGTQVLLADTSAVMVATYSEQYFADTSLWDEALRDHAVFDITLLMGLDLPWVADGLFRDSARARATTDAVLRQRLTAAGVPFQTVYGQGEARLEQALRALGPLLRSRFGHTPVGTPAEIQEGNGRWDCERCSDPQCERRLFSRLL